MKNKDRNLGLFAVRGLVGLALAYGVCNVFFPEKQRDYTQVQRAYIRLPVIPKFLELKIEYEKAHIPELKIVYDGQTYTTQTKR